MLQGTLQLVQLTLCYNIDVGYNIYEFLNDMSHLTASIMPTLNGFDATHSGDAFLDGNGHVAVCRDNKNEF